ncbi:MAG: LLM class flavin-dependent oxidoreductase [Chloroflexota bacterium]
MDSPIEIGIMIEGQEDLTWDRFFKIAETVESLGFDHLFRSDHLTPLENEPSVETLALWPSLTALALRTERIRFGPMVCAMTFRHPSMVAKMAASVSGLANGRLDLGLGAGWYAGEHAMFGINYPKYVKRLERLDEGAALIKHLFSGEKRSFQGKFYRLEEAINFPQPQNLNIIMGGKGEKTLKVVAKHADEWNFSYQSVALFREKSSLLNQNCEEIGRDPKGIRRSLMTPFVIGKNETAVQARINNHRQMFPSLPSNLASWLEAGFIGGTAQQISDQIGAFVNAGVTRFMLQHNSLDDLESLAELGTAVISN